MTRTADPREHIAALAATPCLAYREPWSCLNEPEEDGSPEAPMWERDELCRPCLVRAATAASGPPAPTLAELTSALDADLMAFVDNVETAAEDHGTAAVLIADLLALARDWNRDRLGGNAPRLVTGAHAIAERLLEGQRLQGGGSVYLGDKDDALTYARWLLGEDVDR